MQRETECPCPNADCERRGDCVACHVNYKGKEKPSFCKRPGTVASMELLQRVSARLQTAGFVVE